MRLVRLFVGEWLLGKAMDILPPPERLELARFITRCWMARAVGVSREARADSANSNASKDLHAPTTDSP